MMTIIFGLLTVISLFNLLLFSGKALAGVVLLVISAGAFAVSLFGRLFKKKYMLVVIEAAAVLGFAVAAVFSNVNVSENGYIAYQEDLIKAADYFTDGKYDKALDALEEMNSIYQNTDEVNLLRSECYINSILPEEALNALKLVTDTRDARYYTDLLSSYYLLTDIDKAYSSAKEGAEKNSDSFLLNYVAGNLAAKKGEYNSAEYFLQMAYKLEPSEPMANLSLASIYYIKGDGETAYKLTDYAYNHGINEDTDYYNDILMKWYVEVKEASEYEE